MLNGRDGMSPPTVLVTGAAGFLGRHVVRALRVAGVDVRALARRRPTDAPADTAGEQWIEADLVSSDLVAATREAAAVIHLAAVLKGDDQARWTGTVDSTQRLIAAMAPGSRLVLASSFSVYDWERVGEEVDERSPLLPDGRDLRVDSYARAKLAQERLARDQCSARGIGLVILRPATVWDEQGHGRDHAGVAAGPLLAVVDPGRLAQVTHVADCADAFVLAVQSAPAGSVFNVVDPQPQSAWDFARRVSPGRWRVPVPVLLLRIAAALAGWLRPTSPGGAPRLPGLLIPLRISARFPRARARAQRLQQTLGWSPRSGSGSRSFEGSAA